MRKVEDYQRHVEECRAMLRHATTGEHQQMLTNMMETWESLARNRKAQLERQERMRLLDSKPGISPAQGSEKMPA